MTNCGPGGSGTESCCTSLTVPGGTFYRTYTNSGSGPTGEADPATVSAFRLDKYEVTVGRFRQFVRAWNGGFVPAAGSGKHTHLNGGHGLAAGSSVDAGQTYEKGWVASDDSNIAPTTSNFTSCSFAPTWTASPAGNENLPINCLTWQEAYAFCIWDGGFLPSEAEWEFAAAGGTEEREYPWGSTAPGANSQYAIYDYHYSSQDSGFCNGTVACIAPVGTPTLGAGRWGQLDLAGNVYEWTLDWYAAVYALPCVDCVDVTAGGNGRVNRGGFYDDTLTADLLATSRSSGNATYRVSAFGMRCARVP